MNRVRVPVAAACLIVAIVAASCSRGTSTPSKSAASVTAPAGPGPGDVGTLKHVCGPGSAKGATDQGVTDTTIDVGTMSDPGAQAAPGLNQELFDTAKAFVAWCNNAGGINGRTLTLHLHDSKVFEVAARMVESCGQDLMLVGNGEAFDDSGVATRVGCKLPEIPAFDNSPKATEAPIKVQVAANPNTELQVSLYLGAQHLFPGVTKAGFLVGNLAPVIVTKDKNKDAAEQVGFTTVLDETYPITGFDNPQAYAQRVKDAGVEVLQVVGEPSQLVQIEKGFQTIGWYPKAIVEGGNMYDPNLAKNGGTAVQNTWVSSGYVPFESASQNPATQQYLDIMKTDAPGGKVAALGLNAWDAWLLFATAARDCGSNVTRACVLQNAGSHAGWDGGGLKAPNGTDPANRHPPKCYLALKASASGFAIDPTFLVPNNGPFFTCAASNVVTLKGDYTPKS